MESLYIIEPTMLHILRRTSLVYTFPNQAIEGFTAIHQFFICHNSSMHILHNFSKFDKPSTIFQEHIHMLFSESLKPRQNIINMLLLYHFYLTSMQIKSTHSTSRVILCVCVSDQKKCIFTLGAKALSSTTYKVKITLCITIYGTSLITRNGLLIYGLQEVD